MALDLDAVAIAIAAAVTDAAVTLGPSVVTSTDFIPDAVTVPHFAVAEFQAAENQTYGGMVRAVLTCRLFVARSDDATGQRRTRQAMNGGAGTIIAAIEAARGAPGELALDGACDDLTVQSVRGPRLYEVGSNEYYGAEYTILIIGG